ncbi:MAG TPA: DUF2336 domain-containing protein, partial [Allosphingosinicella sp.]|nr:DUF2336 domain-containing protein [Allosphingosinicella sp.]
MAETGANNRGNQGDAARLLLAAARERFAVAAADLLLPDGARLTEWQRLTAAALLSRLVHGLEDDLRARLAERFEDHAALHAALSSAHVPIALPILERAGALRDADLSNVLVRRVEEHRYWKANAPAAGSDELLFVLVRDGDEEIAAEAMELVIARSRRFDRFQEPAMGAVELPAELQHKLVWTVAAALRHYIVQQHHVAAVDAAIEETASALIAAYDEGATLEARAVRLARRLHAAERLDGELLARILSEGMLPFFIAGLGARASLDYAAAWEVLADPRGRGPALLLKAAGIERESAAAILLLLASRGPLVSGAEGEAASAQLELFDTLDEASARDVLRLWQADPAYRASVARLSTRARPAS